MADDSDVTVVWGDVLDAKEDYIVHQCNCVIRRPWGLSASIFKKYPDANVYALRGPRDVPGTIKVCGRIINLFGQLYPSTPKYDIDTAEHRLKWFESGLEAISKIENIESVAMPYNIGCGLAGGTWRDYLRLIEKFATTVEVSLYNYSEYI